MPVAPASGQPITGLDVPAVNLAVYKAPRPRWTVDPEAVGDERIRKAALRTDAQLIAVADSQLSVQSDGSLQVQLHEPTTRFFWQTGRGCRSHCGFGPPTQSSCAACARHSPRGEAHLWQPFSLCRPPRSSCDCPTSASAFPARLRRSQLRIGTAGRLALTRWGWAHGFPTMEAVGGRLLTPPHSMDSDVESDCLPADVAPRRSWKKSLPNRRRRASQAATVATLVAESAARDVRRIAALYPKGTPDGCSMHRFTPALVLSSSMKPACQASSCAASENTWIWNAFACRRSSFAPLQTYVARRSDDSQGE